MPLKLISAPATEPISITEARAHLRVTDSDNDSLIAIFIKAATQNVEGPDGFLGRALVTQTWELVIDGFPDSEIKIPLPPLQQIVSIKYDDAAGAEQTLAPSGYTVDAVSQPGWVVPGTAGWPSTIDAINAVRIRFICGYAPTADSPPDPAGNVPFPIKAAILLHLGSLYAHREDVIVGNIVSEMPRSSEMLLRPHRVQIGMA